MGTGPGNTALAAAHHRPLRIRTTNHQDKMAAIMDSMCGKWKMDDSKTENFEPYAKAMGMDQETIDKMKGEFGATYEMTKDPADPAKYKCVTTLSTGEEVVSFKLDEKFTEKTMGITVENLFTIEDNMSVGYHWIINDDKSKTETKTKRYIKDGKLIVESFAGDVKMTSVMNKM